MQIAEPFFPGSYVDVSIAEDKSLGMSFHELSLWHELS